MASNAASALLPMLAAGLLGVAVLGVGLWIWYAAALSKLFPRLGGEGWKGWAPVLNEAEILAQGGKPAWGVVFFFIPVVQLYGLYLKIVAAHRINKRFRHGGGFTLLAIILPPLWATLLATGRDPVADRTGTGSGSPVSAIRTRVTSPRAALARDASGYAIPSAAAAESALIDVVPGGPVTAVGEAPLIGSAPGILAAATRAEPEAQAAPAAAAVEAAPGSPVSSAAPAASASRPSVPPPRPSGERWALVLDDGSRLPLTAASIVLGRNPVAAPGVQALRIPDATRTLSKTHARLDRAGSGWTLTDLNSTNGVQAFSRDGSAAVLAPDAPTPVQGRILLGDVGMLLVLEGIG
ncbi:MAG: FHA domain-containing protein [Actinobacteria bacterium]|nr:FHA domain-containing protein [Actinomycetota bacterium]